MMYQPIPLRDPRESYDDLKSLPALGWGWEFVRRNPKLNDVWAGAKSSWVETRADGLAVIGIESPLPTSSPLFWYSARGDTVAWNPAHCAHVLRLIAMPEARVRGGMRLEIASLRLQRTLLVEPNRDQTLILRQGAKSLQLAITGESLTEPVALFVDPNIPRDEAHRQLQLLSAFPDLRETGTLPDRLFPPHPRSARNAQVLKALDGHLAQLSHRDIAVCLYGRERVERDWKDPRENMRDTVRRVIARGQALMERGFLTFLR